jgi:hypothetical protein
LLNIIENSYTAHIARNLSFALVQKHLGDYIQEQLDTAVRQKYVGSPLEMKTRLKLEKNVDPYSSITFLIKKETDLFLAWNQPHLTQEQQRGGLTSEFIPKAKLEVVLAKDS